MHTPSFIRLLRPGAMVALIQVLGVGLAGAQCWITGPSNLCGGSAELCGPEGPYFYDWRDLDNNALGDQQCLNVTAPGVYLLTTFDFINGLSAGPCTSTVAVGEPVACDITGPATACQGARLQLCGPEEAAEFMWSGPDGFTGSTPCVEVSVSGTYEMRSRQSSTACWSNPCSKSVSFERCGNGGNCPVAPWLWLRQCWAEDFKHLRLFDPEQMAEIARCMDERSSSLAWKDSEEGLCRTLRYRYCLRDRARRQFAGVLANVCAHELGLTPQQGLARGLDPETPLQLEGFSGTVGAWLAVVDARLAELDRKPFRDRGLKDDYRSIIRVGWQINHGLGMGLVCSKGQRGSLEPEALDLSTTDTEDESLADELSDPEERHALESLQPNPTSGPARITYVLSGTGSQEVSLGVFDLAGRLVRELDRGLRSPGRHEAVWDGRDADGRPARNGTYFVMGRIGAQRIGGRVIVLRP